MIIDAHFGTSSKERYFDVFGHPEGENQNTLRGQTPKQPSGRFEVKVSDYVGLYAISHPYEVKLTEHMSLDEYCTQTFKEQTLTTKSFARPTELNCAPDQYAKSVTLTWRMADAKNYANKTSKDIEQDGLM